MAESIVYAIAQEVLKNIGASALNEIASAWGFKTQLDHLNQTITTVKNVLLNAEDRQVDDHAVRGWLERLSFVVYAADDLFDEFNTIASRKKLMGGNSVSMKVRAFLSNSNYVCFAFKVSRKIRVIKEQIEAIVKDGEQFQFLQSNTHVGGKFNKKIRRDQTYSFVDAQQVIGRDADKNAILDLLLASSSKTEPQHEVLPIVGIGGQGKTTLAQLVYNDPKVEKSFDLRLWVCISEVLDLKEIVEKILRSAKKAETPKLEIEELQAMLREAISGKKYLLVMDDVWDENRDKWLKLWDLLKMGREGSKILVTTRSIEVAKIMGTLSYYELKGLTNEKSWELFENMAFKPRQAHEKPRLVELGKEIVKKCANVPLAIRTLGSLLYGEDDERKWLSLMNTSLAKLSDGHQQDNDIISILKLSYNDLWSPLKNCFAYCALFPKDYEFDKEMLKELWMAEGFIVADDEGNQTLEDVAEDFFQFLLQRCFFQDIKTDKLGATIGCKMHDLMHDLAQCVAGAKCKVASLEETNFDGKIIHFSYACRLTSSWKIPDSMRNMQLMRTFLMPEQKLDGSFFSKHICKELVSSFSCLRVLDLHGLGLKTVPDSIGNLIHLRYLNLSETPIKELPNSITKLLNLQTLNLYNCWKLQVLPKGIRKLKNLRSLDIHDCICLKEMPSGIGELILLQKLPWFITYYENGLVSSHLAKLRELKQLNNLRGKLHITIEGNMGNPTLEATEANLISKHGLHTLLILFKSEFDDEVVLEGLKPHSNLRKWKMWFYSGQNFPSWARMDNLSISLPNLVVIRLMYGKPQEVPVLSQLRFLKVLYIHDYTNVEYMENNTMSNLFSSSSSPLPTYTETIFFPSLQKLELSNMDSLKGWWKEDDEAVVRNEEAKEASYLQQGNGLSMLSFSKLLNLSVENCPKLITIPLCPNVEGLNVRNTNESVSVLKIATTSNSSSQTTSRLKKLQLSNAEQLISLPMHCLHQLSSLTISNDDQLKSTDTLVEVFARLSSSLRSLEFIRCRNLRSLSKSLGHLTALENLFFCDCTQLDLSPNQQEANEEDEDYVPWKAFKTNLRVLVLDNVAKLVSFPTGFRHLTNLRILQILGNRELRELPEWISCLSSLVTMTLYNSPKITCLPDGFRNLTNLNKLIICECSPILMERCKGPNGSDWLKIQHIPFLIIGNEDELGPSAIYS